MADVTLVLVSVRPANGPEQQVAELAYTCWRTVWSDELRGLGNVGEPPRGEFTRQDLALALLSNRQQCLGTILLRKVNLRDRFVFADRYFEPWPELARQELGKRADAALVASYLAVDPQARLGSQGLRIADTLLGILGRISTQSQPVVGSPRRDRGLHRKVYEWGALPLAQDVTWPPGVPVDLVCYTGRRPQADMSTVETLWRHRLDLRAPDSNLSSPVVLPP